MSERPEVPQDFDGWQRLAARDPEQFEAMRLRCVEEAIARAPAARQERLRRLQWRIENTRRRAATPLGACISLSNMMWEAFAGPDGLLHSLRNVSPPERSPAKVLPFTTRERH